MSWVKLAFLLPALALAAPKGFEKKEDLAKLLKGEILSEKTDISPFESRTVTRAFVKWKESSDLVNVIIDHSKYPDLFSPEIAEAKTTKKNATKTQYEYWLKVNFKVLGTPVSVEPEYTQKVSWAKDATSEAAIVTEMSNYKENVLVSRQKTRIIPFKEGADEGLLIEDTMEVKLDKNFELAFFVKEILEKTAKRSVGAFRKKLIGK